MNRRRGSRLAALIFAFLFLIPCASCGAGGKAALSAYRKEGVRYTALQGKGDQTPSADDIAGKKLAQENEYLALYYQESTAAVSLFDKRTGAWWHSNPAGQNATPAAASQLSVTTISSQGIVRQYTSYTDSLARSQVAFTVDDGLTVNYTFGNVKPELDSVPEKLTDERYRELQGRVKESGADTTLLGRRYIQKDGIWSRKDMTSDQAKKLKELFEIIGYTAEELAADNAAAGGSAGSGESSGFAIPLQYRLEGDSLAVRIVDDQVRYPVGELITSLNVLEYFGALGQGDEGYLFIPDGSGAIVDTAPQKGSNGLYTAAVYGQDYTLPKDSRNGKSQDILLPVFGISRPESGLLAVIEDNEGTASIRAVKPGYVDTFATVSAAFELNATENIGLSSDAISKFYVTAKCRYEGDTALRYIFLVNGNTGYSGMANVYRQYLELGGAREPLKETGDIPFFLETVGAVETEVSTLGFVHKTYVPLTTYGDNVALLQELSDMGVSDIRLILTGWMNGGADQQLARKMETISALGGRKGFRQLLDYAAQSGVSVYPQVLLNTFSMQDGLLSQNQYASRTLGGKKSAIAGYDMVTGSAWTGEDSGMRYLISPAWQKAVADEFLNALKKNGVSSAALGDIAHTSYSDYNESGEVLRQNALIQSAEIVSRYGQELSGLMLSAPNDLTAGGSQLYTDVPASSSSYSLAAASVPFYQMVYHGYADYSFEALNFSADFQQSLLKCAEYGGCPKFKFTRRQDERLSFVDFSDFYASGYSRWMDSAAQAYAFLNELLAPVRNAHMVGHAVLADGVARTDYDNGMSIYVNYTGQTFTADGLTVEAKSAVRKGGTDR